VQPRRTAGDQETAGRRPGVGCHDGLGKSWAELFMRVMRFQSGVKDLNCLLRGAPYGGERLTELICPAQHPHASPSRLRDGHPQPENDVFAPWFVVHWLCHETLAKLKVTRPEIARKPLVFEVASRGELIEADRILSVVIRRVRQDRLEERGRGVSRLGLSGNELVPRGYLIGPGFGYSL
jgi:hypothetical protein